MQNTLIAKYLSQPIKFSPIKNTEFSSNLRIVEPSLDRQNEKKIIIFPMAKKSDKNYHDFIDTIILKNRKQ